MTVDEVRAAKKVAEKSITTILQQLEADTGCCVGGVYAEHIRTIGEATRVMGTNINLKLEP